VSEVPLHTGGDMSAWAARSSTRRVASNRHAQVLDLQPSLGEVRRTPQTCGDLRNTRCPPSLAVALHQSSVSSKSLMLHADSARRKSRGRKSLPPALVPSCGERSAEGVGMCMCLRGPRIAGGFAMAGRLRVWLNIGGGDRGSAGSRSAVGVGRSICFRGPRMAGGEVGIGGRLPLCRKTRCEEMQSRVELASWFFAWRI